MGSSLFQCQLTLGHQSLERVLISLNLTMDSLGHPNQICPTMCYRCFADWWAPCSLSEPNPAPSSFLYLCIAQDLITVFWRCEHKACHWKAPFSSKETCSFYIQITEVFVSAQRVTCVRAMTQNSTSQTALRGALIQKNIKRRSQERHLNEFLCL